MTNVQPVITVGTADTTDPAGVVASPANGSTITPRTAAITGTASDDNSGVSRVRVRIQRLGTNNYWDGTAFTAGAKWVDANLSNNNRNWTLPGVNLSNPADYRIQLAVDDNAGNIAWAFENPTTNFTVGSPVQDTTPPVIDFTSSTTQQLGSVDLTGGVTDDISGVNRVRVLVRNQQTGNYWNGTSWQPAWRWNLATLNGNDTWTLPNVNLNLSGTYLVQLWAWDNDENVATNVTNVQPVITVQ